MQTDRLYLRVQKFINRINAGDDLSDYRNGKVYRASLHSEKQKFLDNKKARKILTEHRPEMKAEKRDQLVKESSLSFSKAEDRAFNAIQKLLDSDKAVQNGKKYSDAFHGKFNSFDIEINYSEYYEAFGLTRNNGSFTGQQTTIAKRALQSLEEERRILYTRQDGKERHLINVRKPLVEIQEADNGINIKPSPLFQDQLQSFHLFKPVNIHEEIKQWQDNTNNYTRAIPNFLQWLNTVDIFPMEIKKNNMVEKIGLSNYLDRSQYQKLEEYLAQALRAAKQLDYLLEWEHHGDKYRLLLNPLKCSRYRYRVKNYQDCREGLEDKLEELQGKNSSGNDKDPRNQGMRFSMGKEVSLPQIERSFTRN